MYIVERSTYNSKTLRCDAIKRYEILDFQHALDVFQDMLLTTYGTTISDRTIDNGRLVTKMVKGYVKNINLYQVND